MVSSLRSQVSCLEADLQRARDEKEQQRLAFARSRITDSEAADRRLQAALEESMRDRAQLLQEAQREAARRVSSSEAEQAAARQEAHREAEAARAECRRLEERVERLARDLSSREASARELEYQNRALAADKVCVSI